MRKFMLGKKVGMTQIFTEDGTVIPATVIDCGPVHIVAVKTKEKDGYNSVKVGYGFIKEKNVNKPDKGQFTAASIEPKRHLKEFKTEETFELGQEIKVSDMFAVGDKVDVTGISKGKGFAGPIKRHGYSRGAESHGSRYHRGVGSMGASATPGRVLKGKKIAGHMGAERVTVQNLEIVLVDGERNILAVKGAVPGPKGKGLLEIKTAVKSGQ